jgi:hypothetical protein
MRRALRLGIWIGLLAAAAWLVQRSRRRELDVAAPRPATSTAPASPLVEPQVVEVGDLSAPGEPEVDTREAAAGEAWVVPEPGGACPASHPIKAKLRSKLFHLPGMLAYDRTNPDRCYRDEAAAEADGLTRAKR